MYGARGLLGRGGRTAPRPTHHLVGRRGRHDAGRRGSFGATTAGYPGALLPADEAEPSSATITPAEHTRIACTRRLPILAPVQPRHGERGNGTTGPARDT